MTELTTIKHEPNAAAIAVLTRILAMAERGEILSVAVAYVDDSEYVARYSYRTRARDRLTLVGALSLCEDDIKRGIVMDGADNKP